MRLIELSFVRGKWPTHFCPCLSQVAPLPTGLHLACLCVETGDDLAEVEPLETYGVVLGDDSVVLHGNKKLDAMLDCQVAMDDALAAHAKASPTRFAVASEALRLTAAFHASRPGTRSH